MTIEFEKDAEFELQFDVGDTSTTGLMTLQAATQLLVRFLYEEDMPGQDEYEIDLPLPPDPDGCIAAAIAWKS